MDRKTFIENLEQLDDSQFKIGLGLTKAQFETLFTKFTKLEDPTTKLGDLEKFYAILICINWNLSDPKLFGDLILNSGKNSKRDGDLFIKRVSPRLERSLKSSNITLAPIPKSREKKVPRSLDEILACIHAENKVILPNQYNTPPRKIQPPKTPTIKKMSSPNIPKQEKKEITERTPAPGFIVNITAYVPSDTDTSCSEESDEREDFEFDEEEFDTPPFEIRRDQRGTLESELVITPGEDIGQYQTKVVKPLLTMLEKEGFADEKDNRENKAKKHLSVSFGLNRPKSLSTGKNKVLMRELVAEVQTGIQHTRFGLFWQLPWMRRSNISMETRGKGRPTYEEVRSYYRQLKKKNPEAARKFRRSEENEVRNGMVPYRDLREITKNHPHTRMLVIDMRQRNPGADTYMSFVDSDVLHFKTDKKGLFQGYTDLYYQFKAPEVMSTGYEYFSEHLPMLQLACLLDRRVREATALYIPFGVYYPEPNFIVKIIESDDTVKESFFKLTSTGKISKENYTSPQESPKLLKKVSKRPNINLPHFSLFSSQNPIQIVAPDRAEHNGSGGKLQFNAIEKGSKYISWSKSDIVNITRNISQSHVSSRDWATNLLNGLECAESVKIGNITITNGATIRRMAISLLSRLYNKYDPITLSDTESCPTNTNYQGHLQKVLENYDPANMSNSIPTTSRTTQPTNGQERIAWGIIDSLSDIAQLKDILDHLLSDADIENIEKAARGSGLAIRDTLLEFLQFPLTPRPQMTPKSHRK